jgi:hypothetical protein
LSCSKIGSNIIPKSANEREVRTVTQVQAE